jgi:hypothetical protein
MRVEAEALLARQFMRCAVKVYFENADELREFHGLVGQMIGGKELYHVLSTYMKINQLEPTSHYEISRKTIG